MSFRPGVNEGPMFTAFIAVWITLGVGLAGLMRFNRDAAFKRRIFPPIMIGVGVLFLAFLLLSGAPRAALPFMVPMIVLITFLNVKLTKFCDACGETVQRMRAFVPPKFCPKCGAPLP